MDLEEAKREATRRWAAMGGWASEAGPFYQDLVVHGVAKQVEFWLRRVGVRVSDPGGTRKVIQGQGRTFEVAFDAADRKAERDLAPKKPQPRKPHPKALPQEELFG